MSSDPNSGVDRDARLGTLIDAYQRRRQADSGFGLESMRVEAGELFEELAALVDGLDLLHACMDEDERLPETVGPYSIVRLLGRGAGGVVYEARDAHGRSCALKALRPALALAPGGRARFEREFDAAARLDHPHIVRVLDRGVAGGRCYIVMELIEGVALRELRGRLDARRVARLFAPVARALAYAGRAGLVHRDLKPGNLLLREDGKLMVADFGVAKVLGETMTASNAVLGTPGFLSPEQAAGNSREVDRRSDVYGLGAAIDYVAPGALQEIVARCRQERPEDRYADADALAADLERAARWPARSRLLLLSVLLLGGSLLAFGLARNPPVSDVPPALPADPFEPAALARLAAAFETLSRLPQAEPPEPRPASREAKPPEAGDALRFELRRYPPAMRDEPSIRTLVIADLIAARQYADAYAAAVHLAQRFPTRRTPQRLALLSLWGLGLHDSVIYREHYARYVTLE